MPPLQFTKMHGLGNDFLVIDGVRQAFTLTPADIRRLSPRETGVGFDQCLVVEASTTPGIDFFYRIFNANGEAVGQCGNGARCIARFIHHYGLSTKRTLTVATHTTQLTLHLNADDTVTVNMGHPKLEPSDIPLKAPAQAQTYALTLPDKTHAHVHALSLGNPHAVLFVENSLTAPVTPLGQQICEHPLFPEQTNVGFAEIKTPEHIHLRVYERGCGETQACGSGAVAAVAAGRLYHQLSPHVRVSLLGGELWVEWDDLHGSIFLTGPASFVYEGRLMVYKTPVFYISI